MLLYFFTVGQNTQRKATFSSGEIYKICDTVYMKNTNEQLGTLNMSFSRPNSGKYYES